MKTLFSTFVLCLLGVLSPVVHAADDATYEAVVTGIRCQACRAEVTRLLKEVPGISNIEISGGDQTGEQRVQIQSSEALTQTKAQEALGGESSGFAITDWKKKS